MTRNVGKSTSPDRSAFRGSVGVWQRLVTWVIGGLLEAPERGSGGGVELGDIGALTGVYPRGPGVTQSAAGDKVPCPEDCGGGNI